MRRPFLTGLLAAAICAGAGCDDDAVPTTPPADLGPGDAATDGGPVDQGAADRGPDAGAPTGRDQLLTVAEGVRWQMPGLQGEVHVVYTEAGIPHVYGANRADVARVHGFLVARDRFWMMDLARRLALGKLSELVGDVLIDSDITNRSRGLPLVAHKLLEHMAPERRAEIDAFAEGVNFYVDGVKAGTFEPPSELRVAGPLLGGQPADLVEPFTALDVTAFAAVVVEQSGCAKGEIERSLALTAAEATYAAVPDGAERLAGLWSDIYHDVAPVTPFATVTQAQKRGDVPERPTAAGHALHFPQGMLGELSARLKRASMRGQAGAVGSNAWAVTGDRTADGATLLAGDGHLPLSVPPYFHQAGLDTGVLGGDDWHVRGNFIAGLPPLGVGTNGHVAWSFTCFYSDTVDYYREEVRLGADGLPEATLFAGEWQPVVRVDETYSTRAVPVLGSAGGEITIPRFETFDGRRLLTIEGEPVPEDSEGGLNLGAGAVFPGDTDGDGAVAAISMDSTILDVKDMLGPYYSLAEAQDLDSFQASHRKLAVMGSHFIVADRAGRLLATAYHGAPCRDHLPRTEDGRRFALGADPQQVLDGTLYGAFELRLNADGTVDESNVDPAACMVPYAEFPRAVDPPEGWVVSGNNDPSGLSFDGSLADDPIYVGGPWSPGLRAARIAELVAEQAEAGAASVEGMARVQADVKSAAAVLWAPYLVTVIGQAQALAAQGDLEGADARVAALYTGNAARFDEVAARLDAWAETDYDAASGVETFYHSPGADEGAPAVATMIFNAWASEFVAGIFDDEGWLPAHRLLDVYAIARHVERLLEGVGPDNPADLVSWDPATGESRFFDDLGTADVVERSDEIALLALRDALDALTAEPEGGEGGFGTADMDAWLWGLRHTVRFESILAPYVDGLAGFDLLLRQFGIAPNRLPLAEDLPAGDPRRGLPGFPRAGDNYSVDNADTDFRAGQFEYRAGPVKRMVIALHPDGRVSGTNVIPGGQSGLKDSPHFDDQVQLWLANETLPLRFHLDEVVAGGTHRDVFTP
ncbi:MAG: penicillin acylase family protein [Myxococcales bacterium]|nr:penicillin acylase family protein [Myxococcales bacterium]MCB9525690.1 penicillin acylase family protein [Myxococcales bacterium]